MDILKDKRFANTGQRKTQSKKPRPSYCRSDHGMAASVELRRIRPASPDRDQHQPNWELASAIPYSGNIWLWQQAQPRPSGEDSTAAQSHSAAACRRLLDRWRLTTIVCLVLAFCTLGCSSAGQAQSRATSVTEYQIKAAFLYNFGRFVEWPPEAFSTEDAPLRICVAGENPFGSDLEETVRGKAIAGHPVHAVVLRALNEARNCHLIFVSSRNSSELKHILEATMRGGVLVVSEAPESAAQGAMINFVLEDERVRFEINDRAAVHARLKISSKLLKLAKTVIE